MTDPKHTPRQFVSDGPLRLIEPSSYGDRRGIVIRDRVGILAFVATDSRFADHDANRVAFAHFAFRACNSQDALVAALLYEAEALEAMGRLAADQAKNFAARAANLRAVLKAVRGES